MDGHEPKVWISDRYAAQQNHGAAQQTCLAHLRATRLLRWSMARTICRCGSSCGSARR